MPRKKAVATATINGMLTPDGRQTRPTFAARYIRVAVAHIDELIVRGREAEAQEVVSELEDFLQFTFRGEALAALKATVSWIRERSQQLARFNDEELRAYGEAAADLGAGAEKHD